MFAAGLEETEVVAWVAGFEDLAGEGDGGAHAGGILIDVERAVEMRDAQALEVELRIEGEVRTEVGDEEFAVDLGQGVEGERFAGFLALVDDFFELGEHGLPVNRAAQVVDLAVEQIRFHLRIRGLAEQMVGEELLVEGGRHLGEEDRIVVILEGLVPLRIPRVHGVSGLVREGEHVGEDIRFVIHQDVGRRPVASA